MNYIAKYQNRYAVPLSSSLSLRGERSNERRSLEKRRNGDMNRISGLVSRPGWFDGFLLSQERQWRVVLSKGIAFSTDFCEPQRYPSSFIGRIRVVLPFHPIENLSHTWEGNGAKIPNSPLIPGIPSGYSTYTPFSIHYWVSTYAALRPADFRRYG